NNDGIGDLPGIIKKLPYLRKLGVETLWINPFFRSPQADFGYDVADYLEIDPQYGTLKDVKKLIREAHANDLKIIFDLVLNHTSDRHHWFQSARKSKNSPHSDWYVF